MASSGDTPVQFADPGQQREAATLGMWIFLGTELLLFGALFLGYSVYRIANPDLFAAASRHLDLTLGTINTAVLLASSYTMALAHHFAAADRRRHLAVFLTLTALLGAAFLGIKAIEYTEEARAGLMPVVGIGFKYPGEAGREAELFFNIYFVMTGLHALHLLIGVTAVAAMVPAFMRMRSRETIERKVTGLGLYWHFVDIVWIFLFPVFYLLER